MFKIKYSGFFVIFKMQELLLYFLEVRWETITLPEILKYLYLR